MRHIPSARWTHLVCEELEPRSMLSALPLSNGTSFVATIGDSPNGGATAFIGRLEGNTSLGNGTFLTSLAGNGVLVGGGFLADVNAAEILAIAAAQNPGLIAGGFNSAGVFAAMTGLGAMDPTNPMVSNNPLLAQTTNLSFNAASGVGQVTIATGANTLGMGATSTEGFYSGPAGTGGPVTPRAPRTPPPEAGAAGDIGTDWLDADVESDVELAAAR